MIHRIATIYSSHEGGHHMAPLLRMTPVCSMYRLWCGVRRGAAGTRATPRTAVPRDWPPQILVTAPLVLLVRQEA